MLSLNDDPDAHGVQNILNGLRYVGREFFLDLQATRKALDHSG